MHIMQQVWHLLKSVRFLSTLVIIPLGGGRSCNWPLCTRVAIAENARPIKEHKQRSCIRRLPIGLSPKLHCNRAANA